MNRNMFLDVLLGVAVGDALGVPVEFQSRESLMASPVSSMRAYGSHHQPAGTWSDDSSLTFCLAEALLDDFRLETIATNFIKWLYHNYWTPHNEIFDVGNTTRDAINRLKDGVQPELAGGFYPDENGNGSLMRILPLLFFIKDKPINERFDLIKQVSSITHGHIRSVLSCFYYLEFARLLLIGRDKFIAYQELKTTFEVTFSKSTINLLEIVMFDRLIMEDIYHLPVQEIHSSGYVIHTLEASVWCLLTTTSYQEAVLKAVNLGRDTDTTAACTGGLAGLLYGHESISTEWVNQLARLQDIKDLAKRLQGKFC